MLGRLPGMAVLASKVKFKCPKGATFAKTFTWKGGRGTPTQTPTDLTGCTARMQVRAKVDDTNVLLSLTTENGGIVLGGAAGTVLLTISATATAALTWKSGVFDLEIQFADGFVRRLIEGSFEVLPEVTRP